VTPTTNDDLDSSDDENEAARKKVENAPAAD
jgi:hypothetical protein